MFALLFLLCFFFSLDASLFFGFETGLFGSFSFETGFLLGFFNSLGFSVLLSEFGSLTFQLFGLDACFLAFGCSKCIGFGLCFLLSLVEFLHLEVTMLFVVLLLKVVEVILKGASLVQQQVEVIHTDDDIVNLSRNPDALVLLKDGAVIDGFLEVLQALDHEQSQCAEVHLLYVIVLNLEGVEIVPCHLIEQHIAVHTVGRVEQNEYLWLVVVLGKGCKGAFQRLGRGVIAQSCGPQHTASVAAAAFESSSLVELLDNI